MKTLRTWMVDEQMLDYTAFLDREGQHEPQRSVAVIEAEPVLDLLERIVKDGALGARYPGHSLILQAAALVSSAHEREKETTT